MWDDNAPSVVESEPPVDESEEMVWRLRTTRAPAKDSIESNHGKAMAAMGEFPSPI